MSKCLIVVDYQYDFVADDGILTAGQVARDIEKIIYNKVVKYLENGDNVVFTLDTHSRNNWDIHPESKQFKLHCEKHTKGHSLYGKLNNFENDTRVSIIEKKAYCPTEDMLRKIIEANNQIEIVGVVTDICVLQTCIGLYTLSVNSNIPIKLILCENGCASFNKDGHKYAINYIKNILGFKIIQD